jgi:hypothetical protein
MRLTTLVFVCLFLVNAYGQSFSYPQLPESANDDSLFVPKDWTLLKSAHGRSQ